MILGKRSIAVLSSCSISLLASCGAAPDDSTDDVEDLGSTEQSSTTSVIKYVFVIPMENKPASQIYGNTTNAPYINNTLIPKYARATNFNDALPSLPSEPHYIWMEAGTMRSPTIPSPTTTHLHRPTARAARLTSSRRSRTLPTASRGERTRKARTPRRVVPHCEQRLLSSQAQPVRVLS
jgi:hypothetical protein